jgi:hypothetical protein
MDVSDEDLAVSYSCGPNLFRGLAANVRGKDWSHRPSDAFSRFAGQIAMKHIGGQAKT